tara:strand:+ start:1887 stop:2078 length:192 start_codon:yes stop_codon:yes gene_type:complete
MESPFKKINYMLFVIGLLCISIGYLIISNNNVNSLESTKIGPVLLFVGYCIIIPVSILYKPKN